MVHSLVGQHPRRVSPAETGCWLLSVVGQFCSRFQRTPREGRTAVGQVGRRLPRTRPLPAAHDLVGADVRQSVAFGRRFVVEVVVGLGLVPAASIAGEPPLEVVVAEERRRWSVSQRVSGPKRRRMKLPPSSKAAGVWMRLLLRLVDARNPAARWRTRPTKSGSASPVGDDAVVHSQRSRRAEHREVAVVRQSSPDQCTEIGAAVDRRRRRRPDRARTTVRRRGSGRVSSRFR